MNRFVSLREKLTLYLSAAQINMVADAYLLAKEAHSLQTRHTGEPYITHPLAVAGILADMRMDPPTLIAALLHDVIEDTAIEKPDITRRFGKEVSDLVDGVTKLTQIEFESYAEAQAENFRKMVMAMARDIRVILIKLADRLHNMQTLGSLPQKKRRRIAKETLEIFSPIANRLGMHALRIELEDLGFSALYPMRYRILKESVIKAHGNRREMMTLINHQIRARLKENTLSVCSLDSREKHLYSIYKKMHDKHLSFTEVMDVYGFRVIVDKVDTCYRILGALHNLYKPLTMRFKDYIAIPKANSYQGLHTTLFGPYGVPIEVQIRTEEMHHTAEYGISAHWLYKTKKSILGDAQQRAQEWLKSVLELDKSSKNSLEFIEHVKTDLFPDEVYVFTPKGNILELPAGSTPVDFAYAIHSDVGNRCITAKLDRRIAPLSTPLTNGQQVEIVVAPNARPNPAWLDFVVTGKARSTIKSVLKKQQREESLELGKRLLENALAALDIHLSHIPTEVLNNWVGTTQLESIAHLLEEIGMGNRSAVLTAKQLAALDFNHHPLNDNKPTASQPSTFAIKGTEGVVVNFAGCCRPIPGDAIGGYITPGQGLMVHIAHCPAMNDIHDNPDKYISLHWEQSAENNFPIDLNLSIKNQRGSLVSLASAIGETESHIESIHARELDDHYISVDLTICVRDRVHLARILRRLRHNACVIRVLRQKPNLSLAGIFHHKPAE